jgi:hypothetical protein
MTSSYHVILPLPAGRKTGSPNTGLLSVMFVPRLQAIGRLADWTRDWSNWPRVINGTAPPPPGGGASAPPLALGVGLRPAAGPFDFSANNGITTASPTWISPDPSQQAWTAVFGAGASSVSVARFRPELRQSGDLAPMYDAGRVASLLREFHRELAVEHPLTPPQLADLAGIPSYNTLTGSGDLVAYDAFMEPLGDGDVSGEDTPEDADFHASLGFLAAHPELLRLLGLIVDLEVTIPAVGAGPFQITVQSNYETSYLLGKTVPVVIGVDADFWPAAASSEGPGRWARIDGASHRVESLDIDAGIAALTGLAGTADDPTATAPAQLRTAGLYVTRNPDDLVAELEERWEAQGEFEEQVTGYLGLNVPPLVLADGEILVAGRRYDVFDEEAGRWFSLWDREVPSGFRFPRNAGLVVATPERDEGWMTYTAFTEMGRLLVDGPGDPNPNPNPNPNPDGPPPGGPYRIAVASPRIDNTKLRVSPVLFSWTGWSLAADPPGSAFSGTTGPTEQKKNEPTLAMPVKVIVDYDVPAGVLPRLRYTHRYKFRARVVDLAGNSLPVSASTTDATKETPLIRFGRTSPLGAPVPIRRLPRPVPGWGDTTTTMVIKSELLQPNGSVTPTSRLLFPPQTDQFQCELHGYPLPDDALFRTQATFDMFVARTATSIDAHADPEPVSGELVSNPQGAWRPGVDYLVEPGASGMAFASLPGSSGAIVSNFDTTWPQGHAVGFEIRAGSAAPLVRVPSNTQATVVAYVPQGITRAIQTSIAGRSDLAAHWALLQDRGAGFGPLRDVFVAGQHWMLASPQALTLIHAVRRPLSIPAVSGALVADRELGSTLCSFAGTFLVDRKSTGSIEVTGTWTDPVDADGVSARPTSRLLFTQQTTYTETTSAPIDELPFTVGDTKRHDAEVSLVAFSRYARHFTERATIKFTSASESVALYSAPLPGSVTDDGIDPFSVRVTSGPIVAVEERDYTIDATAGTIRRVGSTLPLDTDIDVDFLRLPITRRSDEGGGGTFAVTIPNSAVPPALLVSDVLPAFKRSTFNEGTTYAVVHQGQTIRVWVRRPWFLTGNGELLGVLVGSSAGGPLTEVARDAMSPTGPQAPITVDDFPNSVEIRRDLLGDGALDVAGHEVRFDTATNSWFADIEIGTDLGYRPFIKLALVRFQPESVDGAHVSDAVITEPIRLGARREAQVTLNSSDPTLVDVWVRGYELDNVMTAQFQYADPAMSDPDLRWTDIDVPVVLTKSALSGTSEHEWTATIALPTTLVGAPPVRVVIEDAEQLTASAGAGVVDSISYVETIELPAAWTGPPATVPGAPSSVTATPQHQAVTVSWVAPADGGSPILRYQVQQRSGSSGWLDAVEVTAPGTSVLITGLTNGVEYGFRVRAVTAVGAGAWSTRVNATPTATAPTQVGPLQVTGGNRAALVSWSAPPDNGSAITAYRIERRQGTGAWGSGVDLSSTQTRHIARGLTNGVSYEFRVRASSVLGDGPWSDPAAVVPATMVPGRVRRVTAVSGVGSATVSWRPAADRGSSILRYEVQRRAGTSGPFGTTVNVDAAESSLVIAGLAPGSIWQFRVRAVNAVGNGQFSSSDSITILSSVAVPGQVTGVAVVPGDASLTVTWSQPADGGSPISEYTVQQKASSGLVWPPTGVTVPPDQLVSVIAGLVNGTSYDVRVRAVNAAGVGAWSTTISGSPTP